MIKLPRITTTTCIFEGKLCYFFYYRADRETMLAKAKGDDVELGTTLLDNEQKVDLHVPESPGKS